MENDDKGEKSGEKGKRGNGRKAGNGEKGEGAKGEGKRPDH
jgi:hypothetical protein